MGLNIVFIYYFHFIVLVKVCNQMKSFILHFNRFQRRNVTSNCLFVFVANFLFFLFIYFFFFHLTNLFKWNLKQSDHVLRIKPLKGERKRRRPIFIWTQSIDICWILTLRKYAQFHFLRLTSMPVLFAENTTKDVEGLLTLISTV
jgi:hypothetical protein